jgi:hypothetical protein
LTFAIRNHGESRNVRTLQTLQARFANSWMCSTNLVIILGLVQLAKKIPMEDPLVLNGARGVYVLSNLIILGMYLYVKLQIDKKNGMRCATMLSLSTLLTTF